MSLGTEVGLRSDDIVLDGDRAPPTERGTASSPTFRPMSIVAKRSPISATAELLLFFTSENIAIKFRQMAPLCVRPTKSIEIELRDMLRTKRR